MILNAANCWIQKGIENFNKQSLSCSISMPDFSSQVNEVNEHSVNQDSLDWHLNFLYEMHNNLNV